MSNETNIKTTKAKRKAPAKKMPKKAPEVKEQVAAQASGVSDTHQSKIEFKQIVVGVIILFVAALLFLASFGDLQNTEFWKMLFGEEKFQLFKPTHVIVGLSTTAEKDVTYDIYYTVERETWFSENNVAHVQGQKGKHSYHIDLPVAKIYSLRIDFGSRPGAVTVHDVRLMGTQSANLTNFAEYRYHQLEDVKIDEKGNMSFVAPERDPYMYYPYQLAQ